VISSRALKEIDLTPLSTCIDLLSLNLAFTETLASIDLTPLSSCVNLKSLNLSKHKLQTIDLSPLSSCVNLQEINLSDNKLLSIDLSQLSSCENLTNLDLRWNRLKKIDLSPLSNLSKLNEISLWMNHLRSVVLCSSPSLQHLGFGRNKLRKIDLSPLAACVNLNKMSLQENQLQEIDLSPLSSCSDLEEIDLTENQLRNIDFSPLSSCVNLQRIRLAKNELEAIDLGPLSSCTNLEQLWIADNPFNEIDLSPLVFCTHLDSIGLYNDHIRSMDITPLRGKGSLYNKRSRKSSWLRIGIAFYERPSEGYQWKFLREMTQEFWECRRIQQDILLALGLGDYGFIDFDMSKTFESIHPVTPQQEVVERIRDVLLQEISSSVARNGPTTGLELEKLVPEQPRIAMDAQRIIELRKQEIDNLILPVKGDRVNLRSLWITAYGHMVLSSLEMGLSTSLSGLEQVTHAFDRMGFTLKIAEKGNASVKMSGKLKKAIWWIVVNQGKKWQEIR